MDTAGVINALFGVPRALIGVVHVPALPGTAASDRVAAASAFARRTPRASSRAVDRSSGRPTVSPARTTASVVEALRRLRSARDLHHTY